MRLSRGISIHFDLVFGFPIVRFSPVLNPGVYYVAVKFDKLQFENYEIKVKVTKRYCYLQKIATCSDQGMVKGDKIFFIIFL